MDFKLEEMGDWERQKAVFLMGVAEKLGYSLKDCGEVALNKSSGFVYVWSENFLYSLYMPISCELKKSDVVALWTNVENGEEILFNLTEETTLNDLDEWASRLEKEQ